MKKQFPLILMVFSLGFLLSGLLGGLARLGWPLSVAVLVQLHGPIMICGFLGTLIGLERAVQAKHRWGYAAPLFSLAGILILLAGVPIQIGAAGFLVAAGIQFALLVLQWPSQTQRLPLLIQMLGLLGWFMGSLLWILGASTAMVALWWGALPLLTIVGGRLDKFLPPDPAGSSEKLTPSKTWYAPVLAVASLLYLAGLILAWANPSPDAGFRLSALGLLTLSLWLQFNDPACRIRQQQAADRLMALGLRLGYGWLTVAALLLSRGWRALDGYGYDMTLHSLFVGFVFSVILAHLPRMLPKLIGRVEVYHPLFYLGVVILQGSLLLRLAGGALNLPPLRAWGGLLNVFSLVSFLLILLWMLTKKN